VEIPHCKVFELYRIEVITHDPDRRTIANVVFVFEFVLVIVASVKEFWIKVLQNDCSLRLP
jgi:hypothetical protein